MVDTETPPTDLQVLRSLRSRHEHHKKQAKKYLDQFDIALIRARKRHTFSELLTILGWSKSKLSRALSSACDRQGIEGPGSGNSSFDRPWTLRNSNGHAPDVEAHLEAAYDDRFESDL